MGHSPTDIGLLIVIVLIFGGILYWMFAGPAPPALTIKASQDESDEKTVDESGLAVRERSSVANESERDCTPDARVPNVMTRTIPRRSGALSPISVLLVEDDDDSRQMLAATLEYYGAHVVAVGSAIEALQTLESHHADVLVSDLRLPDMDGFALIGHLRMRADPTIAQMPAASITASRRTEDRHHALSAGFQVHMEKPLDPDDLISAVLALATMPRDDRGIIH
jgi:CheY-like chemotaxis protein